MRIIAGRYRGRRLASVPPDVRPSSDRLRETLFGVLDSSVEESVWLEPFAGTGAVALEALSRGASRLILNDNSSQAVKVLRSNLIRCQVETGCEVSQCDAFAFLRRLGVAGVDFVFLDPPYGFRRYTRLLTAVAGLSCLRPTALVILEVFKKTLVELPPALELARSLSIGDSRVLLMRLRTDRQSTAVAELS